MSVTSHQQHLLRQPEPASQLLPSAFTQSMMVSGFLFFTCHLMPPPALLPAQSGRTSVPRAQQVQWKITGAIIMENKKHHYDKF